MKRRCTVYILEVGYCKQGIRGIQKKSTSLWHVGVFKTAQNPLCVALDTGPTRDKTLVEATTLSRDTLYKKTYGFSKVVKRKKG
jgi:hypothetical protein